MSAQALAELESAVSVDEFHALEEKVYKTIELLKSAREAKAIAERDVSRLREQLEEREEEVDTMRQQIVSTSLRPHAGHVRCASKKPTSTN